MKWLILTLFATSALAQPLSGPFPQPGTGGGGNATNVSVSLNLNQFNSGNGVTNIKAGALLTNTFTRFPTNLNGFNTNGYTTNGLFTAGYATNTTNFFQEGASSARSSFWTFNGASGFTWISPSYLPGGVKAVMDLRNDPEPNSVIYLGDASTWDGISMQMKGGGSSGTDPNYPSNRFTVSFGDVWGWRFNQLNLNVGSGQSFGAQSALQCNVISHDDAKNIVFGNTNGHTSLRGTNLTFEVTNGLAGASQAPINAGMVTKNKGWTFYGEMTNNANSLHFANNEGIWWTSIGGDQFKALYVDDSGDDNLIFNANNGGIIFQNAVVAHSTFELDGFLQLNALTASKLVGTASDKKLTSITVGTGLSLSSGTLSATGGGGGVSYTSFVGLISQTGTGIPTVIVIENTLGATPTWGRVAAGQYTVTATGKFTINKTTMVVGTAFDNGDSTTFPVFCDVKDADVNSIPFFVNKGSAGTDAALDHTPVEIRVYP